MATDEESCVQEEAASLPGARQRSAPGDAASAQKSPGMKPPNKLAEEDCDEEDPAARKRSPNESQMLDASGPSTLKSAFPSGDVGSDNAVQVGHQWVSGR